jgi:hypothetical protein
MSTKVLTNPQKALVSQVARVGHQRALSLGLTEETEKDWRGRESIECCGKRVSEALDDDFAALMSHFCNLAGDSQGAMKWALKAQSAPRTRAMWKLDQELKRSGKGRAYAEEICSDVFKCSLALANPDQLKKVMFTIRNRRHATSQHVPS